jgi:hypothetical protein
MKTDTTLMLLLVIILAVLVWMALDWVAEAQGQYWYLTTHYQWQWHGGRWVRVTYPVVCSGYVCKPACRSYYGGWGPCR